MYQKTVLPNGIRIITEYIPYVHSVSLGVWFEVGSRDEEPTELGLSHFIEHMMFKGTERFSAREIAEIMDRCGGHLNAFTSKEHTCYYFRVLDEHFSTAAEVLQQMLLHSRFEPSEIDKERNVVLEELNMYEDTPDELVHDLLCEALWPNHPLGRNVLGTQETISSFSQNMILSFLERNYTTERIVIASAGSIPHERIVEEFASSLSALPSGALPTANYSRDLGGQDLFRAKDTEQIHLCIGGPALSRDDERKYILYLLDTIIGGGVSSFLFQELREERALVYNTYSYNSFFRDSGCFGIYSGFSPKHWDEVFSVIRTQLGSIDRLITDDVVQRAKGQLKGSVLLSLESTNNRMIRLARGEMDFGHIVTPEEFIWEIEQVSKEDVIELGLEVYDPAKWTIAAIGPIDSNIWRDIQCQKIC